MSEEYTNATIWDAEGARVGIVTCRRCGAALMLDQRDTFNVKSLHDQWHTELDNR